jgi:hypothetical protein
MEIEVSIPSLLQIGIVLKIIEIKIIMKITKSVFDNFISNLNFLNLIKLKTKSIELIIRALIRTGIPKRLKIIEKYMTKIINIQGINQRK